MGLSKNRLRINDRFPQFIAVIDSCSAVAMDTHTKYGTCNAATHL